MVPEASCPVRVALASQISRNLVGTLLWLAIGRYCEQRLQVVCAEFGRWKSKVKEFLKAIKDTLRAR